MKKETRKLFNKLEENEISLDLWSDFEEARASMKIEGFEMTDDALICSIKEYKVEGGSAIFSILREQAEREGKNYAELVRQHFKSLPQDQ